MAGFTNIKRLDPEIREVVELRQELAIAKTKPSNYENNLEVQTIGRRIAALLDLPHVKPRIVK